MGNSNSSKGVIMNNNQDNNQDNNNQNGFFDKNPILVFVIFSVVTVMAFKSFFGTDEMNVNGGSTAYGQSINKNVAYSDIKKLIQNGQIEYVGIGEIRILKQLANQLVEYKLFIEQEK